MDHFPYTNKQKLWLKVPKVVHVSPVWIFRLLFHDGLLPLRHSHDLLVLIVLGPLLDGVLSVDFKFKAKNVVLFKRKQTSFKLKLSIFILFLKSKASKNKDDLTIKPLPAWPCQQPSWPTFLFSRMEFQLRWDRLWEPKQKVSFKVSV